ncbi:MAG: hypothetical protein ACLFQK_02670 [Fibrobacterota bacterium]
MIEKASDFAEKNGIDNSGKIFYPRNKEDASKLVVFCAKNSISVLSCVPADPDSSKIQEESLIISTDRFTKVEQARPLDSALAFESGATMHSIIKIIPEGFSTLPFCEYPEKMTAAVLFGYSGLLKTSDAFFVEILKSDGKIFRTGTNVFSSVSRYNFLEFFSGTGSLLGIPLYYGWKLQPDEIFFTYMKKRYSINDISFEVNLSSEEKNILTEIKKITDPAGIFRSYGNQF